MTATIRISGLVRKMASVQKSLAGGLNQAEILALRASVDKSLRTVDEILKTNRARPENLPKQSFLAYKYLKDLDWNSIRPDPHHSQSHSDVSYTISGLAGRPSEISAKVRTVELRFQNVAEQNNVRKLTNEIHAQVVKAVSDVEASCGRKRITLASLTGPSLSAYQWLKFLSDRDAFRTLLSAAHVVGKALRSPSFNNKDAVGPKVRSVTVEFANQFVIYRHQRKGDELEVKLSIAFIGAPEDVLVACLRSILLNDRDAKARVKEYTSGSDYLDLGAQVASIGVEAGAPAGNWRDLKASFQRMNARYFQGNLKLPRLYWSQSVNYRLMGCWVPADGKIVINRLLDSADVPDFVLDFVMYHEMLHIHLGAKLTNGGSRCIPRSSERWNPPMHSSQKQIGP